MKKLLLSTAAIAGMAMIATPAAAQVQLDLGGYFKGYGAYVDQDEGGLGAGAVDTNEFDIIRNTEVHFGGETTLDNGLTVGAHLEVEADGGDGFGVDESYIYMSGGWGRVNFGDEDGAGYLLQVAAPSADSNIDGIRQFVSPVNYTALINSARPAAAVITAAETARLALLTGGTALTAFTPTGAGNAAGVDYDMDQSGKTSKITYLSPIMNGFQVGASFSPDTDAAGEGGIGTDDVVDVYGETYEISARYEGQFNNVGVILGAGFAHSELEASGTTGVGVLATNVAAGDPTDDRQSWNVGVDLDIGPFGIGAVYVEDDAGDVTLAAPTATDAAVTGDEEETIVVGVDYTTGPFKLGASYLDQDNSYGIDDLDTQRYSGGVVYTYGPGMTFRGSIGHVEHELGAGLGEVDATYVTLGTQVNF